MANFVIRPKDYTDLSENYSEKNVINTVEGKEYEVTSINSVVLDTTTINPETASRLFTTQLDTGYWIGQKYNRDLIAFFEEAKATGIFGALLDIGYPRTEALFFSGSYSFDTEEVISDINSVSCSFTINYTDTSGSILIDNEGSQKAQNITSFFYTFPSSDSSTMVGEENQYLPVENAKEIVSYPFGATSVMVYAPIEKEYCRVTKVQKTATGYKITIAYKFRIWGGWTFDSSGGAFATNKSRVLSVNSIKIKTFANTVDTNEIDFLYQDDLVNTERKYELETNELFQAKSTDDEVDRLSYKTYQKVVDAYDTDRRIITFDLLNPVKVNINDNEKFETGEEESRYLDTDDEFDIYDEHNDLMGAFKVIQSNPIWDGSYHKRITAILVD